MQPAKPSRRNQPGIAGAVMCSPMRSIRISWEDQVTELTARYVIEIIVIGIVATLVTDIWQRLLQAIAGVPPAQWGLIGRWVAGFPRGVFVHQSIVAAQSVRGELALGWAFHYAIGIAWAALYVAIVRFGLNSGPTLISALAVSLAL